MKGVHRSFLDVGVDVVETNAFGGFGVVLAEYGLAGPGRGDQPGRRPPGPRRPPTRPPSPPPTSACAGWPATSAPAPRFPTLGQIPYVDLRDAYEEQATALLAGGVDLLIVETVYDLLQAKAAINAAKRAMVDAGRRVPLQVQVTIELTGRMLPGHRDRRRAHRPRRHAPRRHRAQLRHRPGRDGRGRPLPVRSTRRLPVSVQPNAGLPSVVDGAMHYDLTPEQLADHLERFVTELGVSVIGGCCGTTPEHLRGRGGAMP